MEMEKMGVRVRAARQRLGLRPEHLAAALNMSVATIYNLEKDTHVIRADKIVPLAEALHVSPLYLLGCEDAPV